MTPLDAMPDALFWPLFLLAWLALGLVVAWCFGAIVRWVDNPKNRYEDYDRVAERKRRLARNGFKSKQGIR